MQILKNLKCKLNNHDWEIIEEWSTRDIVDFFNALNITDSHDVFLSIFETNITWPCKKVCLNCGKCINQIEDFKEAYSKKINLQRQKEEQRKELANKIWADNNCH